VKGKKGNPYIKKLFFLDFQQEMSIIANRFWRKGENEKLFEDFPFVYNSAVFLHILFEKKTITIFGRRRK
jgi:hypothetical protein